MTWSTFGDIGWRVIRHHEVESTMDEAAKLAREGAPAGTVVVADHQIAGRGQRGHDWLEPPGTCLLTTILLCPPLSVAVAPDLSRSIAARVAETLNNLAGIEAIVKHPNDVLVNGRKICGILSQSSIRGDVLDYLLVGIGINVNVEQADLPLASATSLLVETGRRFDRDDLLWAILNELTIIPGLCDGFPAKTRALDLH